MSLNKNLITKFQALYLEKFATEISYDIAELQLKELADLVRNTASAVRAR